MAAPESRLYTTAFVSGNHENYDLLATYPVSEWHSGKIQCIRLGASPDVRAGLQSRRKTVHHDGRRKQP